MIWFYFLISSLAWFLSYQNKREKQDAPKKNKKRKAAGDDAGDGDHNGGNAKENHEVKHNLNTNREPS